MDACVALLESFTYKELLHLILKLSDFFPILTQVFLLFHPL